MSRQLKPGDLSPYFCGGLFGGGTDFKEVVDTGVFRGVRYATFRVYYPFDCDPFVTLTGDDLKLAERLWEEPNDSPDPTYIDRFDDFCNVVFEHRADDAKFPSTLNP